MGYSPLGHTEATDHTHTECIISRVNPNVNYELSMITVYQCRFINCTISVEDKNRLCIYADRVYDVTLCSCLSVLL